MIIEALGLSYRYPRAEGYAVSDVTLAVNPGELVCVVGPNGSGKTTLLRLLGGALEPERGEVWVMGRRTSAWRRRELARLVGVVSQREEPVFPLTVEQTVMLGRYPHLGPLGAPRAADVRAVERAMEKCDVTHLAGRWVATLSGGEWQRVRIARALAQEPRALLLDEPTANLDLRHEMEVFELVAQLAAGEGVAVFIISHHVNVAVRYGKRIVLLDRGRVRASGSPAEVLQQELLESVFGWPVDLIKWHGVPQVVPCNKALQSPTSGKERL